jgi:hypothetical protein
MLVTTAECVYCPLVSIVRKKPHNNSVVYPVFFQGR